MAYNETRAAEYGGEIVTDTAEHTYKKAIALRALETTVITTITSTGKHQVEGIGYFDGKTIYPGDTIEANIATLQLASGAVQVYFRP